MLLTCPTRHGVARRAPRLGLRHARPRPSRRRQFACRHAPARPGDALAGSFDPIWTAGAEARLITGALRTPSRHPLLVAGRVLLLLAILTPALGPLRAVAGALPPLPTPVAVGLVALLAWSAMRLLGSRNR